MKKHLAILLAVMMVAAMLGACGDTAAAPAAPSQDAAPAAPAEPAPEGDAAPATDGEILIGLSCALTGNFPLAGQRTREGVDLALEEINAGGGVLGKKLVYTIEDDQNTQTTAVNVVTKILTQDVAAVIGPHTSGNAMATNELYKNAQVAFLTGGHEPQARGGRQPVHVPLPSR